MHSYGYWGVRRPLLRHATDTYRGIEGNINGVLLIYLQSYYLLSFFLNKKDSL
jgi:hypothetical protein